MLEKVDRNFVVLVLYYGYGNLRLLSGELMPVDSLQKQEGRKLRVRRRGLPETVSSLRRSDGRP